jgi:hypothetical protein
VSSCISPRKIKAALWINNLPVPEEVCKESPELKDYGIYRRLNDGSFEFVSVCDKVITEFFCMHKDALKGILNETGNEKTIKEIQRIYPNKI